MDEAELILLYDYYGALLTQRQRECFELRYNEDLSLGEIAESLGVSRQAVNDNLTRTEALLRRMEENIGSVKRDMMIRSAIQELLEAATVLGASSDPAVQAAAQQITAVVDTLKE